MEGSRVSPDEARRSLGAIALVGVIAGLVFGLWPTLDLKFSLQFYDAAQRNWPLGRDPTFQAIRDVNEFRARMRAGEAAMHRCHEPVRPKSNGP